MPPFIYPEMKLSHALSTLTLPTALSSRWLLSIDTGTTEAPSDEKGVGFGTRQTRTCLLGPFYLSWGLEKSQYLFLLFHTSVLCHAVPFAFAEHFSQSSHG